MSALLFAFGLSLCWFAFLSGEVPAGDYPIKILAVIVTLGSLSGLYNVANGRGWMG